MKTPASQPLYRRLWNLMTSRKIAAVLLLATLLVLLLGLWFPQVPHDLDAAGQDAWWAAARERYGPRLERYERLGLTDLYGSPLFLGLLAALLLNTLLCTVERFGRLWREAMRRPAVCLPDAAYAAPDWQAEGVTLEAARQAMRCPRSRLRENPGRPHYLYGERWRLAPLGTVLTHLGLFLFVLAALLHGALASRERLLVPASAPDAVVEVEAVYDPGAGPFVAGGFLLTAGGSLSLLFPRRRVWARLDAGRLQVRLSLEGPAAAAEIARLERRLGRPPGGAA
jgi:cytochrome c biogenesis protein ResB